MSCSLYLKSLGIQAKTLFIHLTAEAACFLNFSLSTSTKNNLIIWLFVQDSVYPVNTGDANFHVGVESG